MVVPGWAIRSAAFLGSVLLALVASSVVLIGAHHSIYDVYGAMYEGALGSPDALQGSLVYAEPIAFTGLAAAVAFRARVWNIGGEGQMAMGAFGAALVALNTNLPPPFMLLAVVASGALFGALWGLLPAALKVWLGVNEVLSTLMLNYVAALWIQFLVFGPWRDPSGGWPYSVSFPADAMLPPISELDIGILVAPGLAVILWLLLRFTRWGFELSVVGHSHSSARYAAISVSRITLQVMVLSGAIAALAGIQQVSGAAGKLYVLTPGYGYLGILVSWLAAHDPVLVVLMATLYGVLLQAGAALQIAQVDPHLVRIMQSAIILFALAGLTLAGRYTLKRRVAGGRRG